MKKIILLVIVMSINIASDFKDVRVLEHIDSKSEMNKYMKSISKDLGVKCSHCHNMNNKSENTPEKDIAREMILLTKHINQMLNNKENDITLEDMNVGSKKKNSSVVVTCWTCHKGNLNVENIRP
tara:strand:- start:363 stop:737 length:375 start_codon:yes stop_codon:yes gene_type:complete